MTPPIQLLGQSELEAESPSALRSRLAELKEEAIALKSRMEWVRAEQKRAQTALDSFIYPILTLPTEITSEIFTHYVHEPRIGRPRSYNESQSRGPLPLAGVCRTWRDVCLANPSLWATLSIYPTHSWPVDAFLRLLKSWLDRAGNHPLHLRVFQKEQHFSYATEIYTLVSRYSSTIRTFDVALDQPHSFPNAAFQGCLPLLTKLHVKIAAVGYRPDRITAFADAPKLREVGLSGASFEWLALPWIQLTKLELASLTVSNCFKILQETTNLQFLTITTLTADRVEPTLSPQLTLPRLHSFILYYTNRPLLNILTLPALRYLYIGSLGQEDVPSFQALSTRSEWPLQAIRICRSSSKPLVLCLRSVPSVTDVDIEAPWDFREAYTFGYRAFLADNSLLPALRSFTLRPFSSEAIRDYEVAEIVEFRSSGSNEGIAKLEVFRLICSREVPRQFMKVVREQLLPLKDAGLKLAIMYEPLSSFAI
ncbi:F-box domain-containing protein [Favolaschia claudopus]|uniref:F-box domain-containing protein n=1 Tax=Favolaschia claudopus TaxID=2862362 RepID=A0AAW0DV42_9AGAR